MGTGGLAASGTQLLFAAELTMWATVDVPPVPLPEANL